MRLATVVDLSGVLAANSAEGEGDGVYFFAVGDFHDVDNASDVGGVVGGVVGEVVFGNGDCSCSFFLEGRGRRVLHLEADDRVYVTLVQSIEFCVLVVETDQEIEYPMLPFGSVNVLCRKLFVVIFSLRTWPKFRLLVQTSVSRQT